MLMVPMGRATRLNIRRAKFALIGETSYFRINFAPFSRGYNNPNNSIHSFISKGAMDVHVVRCLSYYHKISYSLVNLALKNKEKGKGL